MHELNPFCVVVRSAFHIMVLKFIWSLFKFSQCGKGTTRRCLVEQRRDGGVDPPFHITENDDVILNADLEGGSDSREKPGQLVDLAQPFRLQQGRSSRYRRLP